MRLIDADRLKAILEKNFGHTGGASVLEQLIDEQPTIKHEEAQLSKEGTTKDATSDLISRQQAIDALVQCTNCGDEDTLREYVLKHSLDNGWTGGILEALDAVKDLPTAQPEPHEGRWIEGKIYRDVIECNCSECGQLMTTAASVRMNFCPKCGAKMKGERQK